MNMAEYTSSWQSAAGADKECQYLNQLYEDLKVTFLTEGSTFKFPFFWNTSLTCITGITCITCINCINFINCFTSYTGNPKNINDVVTDNLKSRDAGAS